jgi:hypothetical protein
MRTRVRPGRAGSAMGIVVGVLMLVIGIAVVIPMTSAAGATFPGSPLSGGIALFGVVWVLFVLVTIGYSAYSLLHPSGATLYEIETEGSSLPPTAGTASSTGDFDERLRKLQRLRDDGLLTAEEFQRKRDEILAERW